MEGKKNKPHKKVIVRSLKTKLKITSKEKTKKADVITLSKLSLKHGLHNKKVPLRERLKEQLKASRFRYFNEQFYVSSSSEAREYFKQHPDEFDAYHEGYEHQASLWPVNPVNEVIKEIQRRPKSEKKEVVADFGCGQAKIAQTLDQEHFKVFSFDLVAVNNYVTACDMAHTNLFNNSVDITVFCLSLMGSNISDYVKEANRVLREDGLMKIAEVKSRFDKVDDFVKNIKDYGFVLLKKKLNDPAFYYFDFKKSSKISKKNKKKLPDLKLNPCLYKHR